eukprot:TRINITY_DN31501_c0_g1_i1.p1 TRINITY_DN31501_c0_g1~~TRINITY_DN31501_c0_g1_i1.p1  ORF type:complete len:125 (-),score=30.04 TRINITY_DN31501_c0_g1_i1:12-386(-)
MIRRPPRSTLSSSSAASDVYKRQQFGCFLSLPSYYTTRSKTVSRLRERVVSGINFKFKLQGLSHSHLVSGLSLIHISEPTRLLSISYAVFCLKKKKKDKANRKKKRKMKQEERKKEKHGEIGEV